MLSASFVTARTCHLPLQLVHAALRSFPFRKKLRGALPGGFQLRAELRSALLGSFALAQQLLRPLRGVHRRPPRVLQH
jgi:hypothetical protein